MKKMNPMKMTSTSATAVAGSSSARSAALSLVTLPLRWPLFGSCVALTLILAILAWRHWDVFSLGILVNLLGDNAFLGVAAVGMTFVILSGGIDLSVGAMIGFASVALATMVETHGLSPGLAIGLIVGFGTGFGALMGGLVAAFEIAPFLVTLGGMFLLRGLALALSLESLSLNHHFLTWASGAKLPITSDTGIPVGALIFLVIWLVAVVVGTYSVFGRYTRAIGDSEDSSALLGLPVLRTKIQVYAVSGFCSAVAGVLFALYTSSGNANAATGLELDAIAAVVIGGTLLTGGRGTVVGTAIGVLILGAVQTLITFEGTLNSWWSRIVTGALLLLFILVQKIRVERE